MSGRVQHKVAFITGAAGGQGRNHAIRLAAEGADIVAVDICRQIDAVPYRMSTSADLGETGRAVEALGRRVVAREVDVRDFDGLKAAVEAGVAQLGSIDIVSANAGIFIFGGQSHEISEAEYDEVVDINQKGVWQTCKAVIPQMIEQGTGGSIVITSSTAGHKGTPNVLPYTASKHAVIGIMRTLALELAEHMIRVNTIHPAGVATEMILNEATYKLLLPNEEHPTREQAAKVFASTNALPISWVQPDDVSNALLFLASDESRYVTGLELKVDAGFQIR